MLQYIEQQIRQSEAKPGTLIHIGAGTGSELQEYLNLNFSRIVLYEATPELAEELREKCRRYQQVSVEQAVVAGQEGKATFHRMNNPRFSSLTEQKTLKDYYPNLRSTPLQVEAVSLTQVINGHMLSEDAVNVLILELQGAEEILKGDIKKEDLQQFKWIAVNSFSDDTKENTNSSAQEKLLSESEFVQQYQDNESYPFFISIFTRDDNAIAYKSIKAQNHMLQGELEKEKTETLRLESQLGSREKEIGDLQERVKDLQSQVSENQALQKSLESKDNQIQEAEVEMRQLREKLEENETTLKLNTKILAKTQQDLDNLREKYSEKVRSENELQELISELYEKLKMASNFYSKLQDKHPELLEKQMD